MNYYIYINGNTIGPMTEHQLFAYNVNQNTNVSTDGINWRPLYTYPDLMVALRQRGGIGGSDLPTKKLLCGLFAIFLGYLGVQYFILGKALGGVLTILLCCITCGLWSIVTFIQGILMLCMSDEEFKHKYIENPATMPLF